MWDTYVNSTAPHAVALGASVATIAGLIWTMILVVRAKGAAEAAEQAASDAGRRFAEIRLGSVVDRLARAMAMLDTASMTDTPHTARFAIEEWERAIPELLALLRSSQAEHEALLVDIAESKRLCNVAVSGLGPTTTNTGLNTRSLRSRMSAVVFEARLQMTASELHVEPLTAIAEEIP